MNDLILINTPQNALEIFKTEAVDDILKKIHAEVKSRVLDISTPEGRKEIASLAYKVAKTKTALDEMGKDLVDEWKQKSKIVDIERKRIRDDLDALKEEVRRPLTEWENAEKLRVDNLTVRLENLAAQTNFMQGQNADVATIERHIIQADELYKHEWQEFTEKAGREYKRVSEALAKQLAERKQYDADQAELARLRAEQEAREKAEREKAEQERIEKLKEAAEKAKQEAEAKAKAEQEKRDQEAKAEKERIEREAAQREADAKAETERVQREKDQAEARAKQAEADRLAAEQKAKDDAAAAEKKRLEDVEKARKDEEARQQRIREQEAAETKRREEDKEHRRKINKDAVVALSVSVPDLEMGFCQKVIEAIAKGQIPNVKINY